MSITTWGWGSYSISTYGWGTYLETTISYVPILSAQYLNLPNVDTDVYTRSYDELNVRSYTELSTRTKPTTLSGRLRDSS